MSRRPRVPAYRLHKQSGQAVVTLTDGLGNRRDVLLGRHGSPESRAEYARVILEWETSARRFPARSAEGSAPADLSVNEVLLAYFHHVAGYYVKDGAPSSQQHRIRQALRPVKELYGHTPARDFGPLALKAVRAQLVFHGYVRRLVNQMAGCIRQMFKWAVAEELVPSSVSHGLQAVVGLKKGRTEARESRDVKPVALAVVEDTLPHLSRHVAGMVRVQVLTGMRSGEVCLLRGGDLDMSGPVWIYRLATHKTAHHGKSRVVAIGPRAQEVIRPFLKTNLEAYLFCPAESRAEWEASKRRPASRRCSRPRSAARRSGRRRDRAPTTRPRAISSRSARRSSPSTPPRRAPPASRSSRPTGAHPARRLPCRTGIPTSFGTRTPPRCAAASVWKRRRWRWDTAAPTSRRCTPSAT